MSKTSLTDKVKEEAQDLTDIGKDIVARTPARALGWAVVLVVLFGGFSGLFYLAKDTVVKVFEMQSDVKHLHAEHELCRAELVTMKAEVKELRGEVDRLKARVAVN